MVSGYSGVEGYRFLIRWCFMARSGNWSAFTGISDCAGLNRALQPEYRRCIVIRTPFAGRGDGRVIYSQSLMRKRDIVSRMNENSTLRDSEVTT
jgi:hypothetical protein